MAKEWAKPFYNSRAWIKCRAAFISKRISIDGGMCQSCGKELGYIVDHVTELTPNNITDPDIALSDKNFNYLCLDCHNRKNSNQQATAEGLRFDENGDLVKIT